MVSDFFKSVELKKGVWYGANEDLSYPDEGNKELNNVEAGSFWFKHRNSVIQALLEKYGTSDAFVDIGGGNGFVSLHLQESLGKNVICVEPGHAGAINAKLRNVENVVCAIVSAETVNKNSLPDIGMFDVLEHIELADEFLVELYNLMKEGSKILITVPAFSWLWSNEDTDGGHFKRYTTGSLSKALKMAGFDNVLSSYFFSFLPLPIFLLRTIPSFFGVKRSSVQDTRKIKQDHEVSSSTSQKLIDRMFEWELSRLKQGKKIYFGSSVILVAQKTIPNS